MTRDDCPIRPVSYQPSSVHPPINRAADGRVFVNILVVGASFQDYSFIAPTGKTKWDLCDWFLQSWSLIIHLQG